MEDAILDRETILIIAGVVLATLVAGISWMYKQYKAEKEINDLTVITQGIIEYYRDKGYSD